MILRRYKTKPRDMGKCIAKASFLISTFQTIFYGGGGWITSNILKMRSTHTLGRTVQEAIPHRGKHDPGSAASGYVSHHLCCKNNGFSKTQLLKAPELVKLTSFNCREHF